MIGRGVMGIVGILLVGFGPDQAKKSNASKSWRVGAGMIFLVIIIASLSAAKELV